MDDDEELSMDQIKELIDSPPIVRVVNLIISQAINDRATAIHIEHSRVRYRVDGVLYEVMNPPEHIHVPLVARIKVMGLMDIFERRIPQDGKIRLQHDQVGYVLRVSILPCDYGEKVVIKIKPEEATQLLSLDQLGLSPQHQRAMQSLLQRRSGLLLISGFRRGGKSATLYACLHALNQVERNLQSIEDPIEVRLPGVNQIQVHTKVGLTFASAFRACLRSDPDVIVVGEVHSQETCRLAVDAACDRHLVLGASYNYGAASSVAYLYHYGIEPYLVAKALNGALSQRLARRLCPDCKTSEPAPPGFELESICSGVGCDACNSVGTRGQIGIQELMINSPALQECIASSPTVEQLNRVAREQGMIGLREDGLKKVADGLISLTEMLQATRD